MRALLLVTAFAVLSGCFGPPSRGQRLADSAYEVSNGLRFGRLDLALAHVSPKEQAAFMQRRAHWGRTLRIVDVELAGMSEAKDNEADVILAVTWQRADEAVVRVTFVTQRWREDQGWKIVGESRQGGDFGLFGEAPPATTPEQPAPRREAQLRTTHVIAGGEE